MGKSNVVLQNVVHKKVIGGNVSLAPVNVADADRIASWLTDLEVAVPLGSEAYLLMTELSVREDIARGGFPGSQIFSIIANDGDETIGRCMLFDINHVDRTAMVGIFIGDKSRWGRGYGTEALRLLLDYGFNLLNLNSVMLGVFAFNTRALNCYRKVGFKEIGRRREARMICGRYHDGILMDLLASEFDGGVVRGYVDAHAEGGAPAENDADIDLAGV